jgi:mediator of RNA polymerase II transcription subunit 12
VGFQLVRSCFFSITFKTLNFNIFSGHKTPAPLSWSWFGAVKHERKPMKYEESFQELKHASIMEKPKEYFTDPPPLPPEDLEPANVANQNKNEINQMNQMMMQNRGGK